MKSKISQAELRAYPSEIRAHSHAHHQIVLPLQGALELETGGRGGFVDRYAGALIRSGDRHAFQGHRDAKCLVMDLEEDGDWDRRFERRDASFFTLDPSVHHLLRFIDLQGGLNLHTEALLLSATFQMLSEDGRVTLPKTLREALTFLEANLHRPVMVAAVAKAAGVSESVLYALFKDWLGTSPMGHLKTLRIRRAKATLRRTRDPISQIALDCGYADQTAFTRAFRKAVGSTPAAFRRTGDA